jgi:hypothetical protein
MTMRKLLLAAVALAALSGSAQAEVQLVPKLLRGEWCQVGENAQERIFEHRSCNQKTGALSFDFYALGFRIGVGKSYADCVDPTFWNGTKIGWFVSTYCEMDDKSETYEKLFYIYPKGANQIAVRVKNVDENWHPTRMPAGK